MKYKRIMAGAFALALTLPLLLSTAHAHPGRTDANGGHTDSDTGDYHYHHGYEAHAHFDIDGNGTIDCPFDFVDATNHSSGTSSSSNSYTPGDGSGDGYQEGYADGYKKGEQEGQEVGYEDGAADTRKDYEEQILLLEEEYDNKLQNMVTPLLWVSGIFIVLFLVSMVLMRISEKTFASKLKKTENDCAKSMERLISDHTAQINKLNSDHAAEVKRLKLRFTNFKRLEVLERIANGSDDSIKLPDGVRLKPSYTPVRGNTTKHYPYGTYTVFVTYIGKVYHCRHDCAHSARPMHFFDLPDSATPCRRCVPPDMRPQPLPEWYHQIRQKLDDECADDTAPSNQT